MILLSEIFEIFLFKLYLLTLKVNIGMTLNCKPIPVMKTGFSLCSFSHMVKPVFIPANENRFFPVWESYTGKTLNWPFTGLQCP